MSDNGYRPPPPPKVIFDHPKLKIYAPCPTPGGKGKKSSLGWKIHDNNPRIVVYTNCPDDTGEQNEYGKINANMDAIMFSSLLIQLKRLAAMETPASEPIRIAIANKKAGWDRQANRPGEPYEVSTTWIGKDTDGRCWITVRAKKKERPVIKFFFGIPEFHDMRNADGSAWTEGQKSELGLLGYIQMLEVMMPYFLAANYKEAEKKEGNNRGGNGGGYNRGGGYNNGGGNRDGGNSGGGANRSNNDMDDDIPF